MSKKELPTFDDVLGIFNETSKEEFENMFWNTPYTFNFDDVWNWVEKYAKEMCKEQRIDECKKWYSDMLTFDLRLDSFVIRLDDYCENRIKELNK